VETVNFFYVPTPPEVVEAMLQAAAVTSADVVYDLGCGDGRIVITAAEKYGARGIGFDLNPERVAEANENARQAGVADRVEFRQQDIFEVDLSEATVVTLYLLPWLNNQLRPKLQHELRPGTRIVSHGFFLGDWWPYSSLDIDGHFIYFWEVPPKPDLK